MSRAKPWLSWTHRNVTGRHRGCAVANRSITDTDRGQNWLQNRVRSVALGILNERNRFSYRIVSIRLGPAVQIAGTHRAGNGTV